MPLDTNGLGLIQNGLELRGFRVRRIEVSGEIIIKGEGRRNQSVELRIKVVAHNKYLLEDKH